MSDTFTTPAAKEKVNQTIQALIANGISAEVVATKEAARQRVLELIPKGAEVMNMTSVTLDEIGIPHVINESGEYISVRNELNAMDRETQSLQMQKLGAAPDYALGSVHAVTVDGEVLVASNTGSQLSAYVYGSPHIIWVVGTQKIVESMEDGIKRIDEYILPKESVRLRKAYNLPNTINSFVSKLLIFHREVHKERIHLIFVPEQLGF